MIRSACCIAVALALAPSASAQSRAPRTMLRPITGSVKDAGVYHFGLGTWTRHVDSANGILNDVVYANTCPTGYYAGQFTNEFFADEGRVPSPNGPILCDSPGLLSTNHGCLCNYNICGFQIAYCSGIPGLNPISVNIGFQGGYSACAVPSVLPGSPGTFDLTGLPGAGSSIQGCWVVTIDLDATSQSFVLPADGASCTWLASGDSAANHLFGWTFQNKTAVTGVGNDYVGPLIAGNGGPFAPTPACSMVDGTRWDTLTCAGQGGGPAKFPNNLTEDGWGMDSQDRFRDDTTNITGGPVSGPGPGCFFFGNDPVASFYLKLFSNTLCCGGCVDPYFCRPLIDFTTPACPCGNPPTTPGAGCNALSPPGPGTPTGGARMTSTGNAVPYDVGTDTQKFSVTGLPTAASESAYLLQGTATLAVPLVFGQGLRCCGGALKRMQIHTAPGTGTSVWPAAGDLQPTISQRSNSAPGAIVHITPGQTYCYFIQYRQSLFGAGCALPSNFNASNAANVLWHL